MYFRWAIDEIIIAAITVVDGSGAPVTGLTVPVFIQRRSDNYYFNGSTWQVGSTSVNCTEYASAGIYRYSLAAQNAHDIYDFRWAYAGPPAVYGYEVHVADEADANLVAVAGTANASATLSLKAIVVNNSAGSAVSLTSSGSNGHAIVLQGNGSGHGVYSVGGASGGHGFYVKGGAGGYGASIEGAGGGYGLSVSGNAAAGIVVAGGTNSPAIWAMGNGTGAGIRIDGGASGNGATFTAGGTAGYGISMTAGANSYSGLYVAGNGVGAGAYFVGGATGAGVRFVGGGTSGAGIEVSSTSGNGITVTAGGGNGSGISTTGNGTGHGLIGTGGASGGAGMWAAGGATAGTGFGCGGGSGGGVGFTAGGNGASGMVINGGSNRVALQITGNGTNSTGIGITYTGTGSGISASGGAYGLNMAGSTAGIYALGSTGNAIGLSIVGAGGGAGVSVTAGSSSGNGMEINAAMGQGLYIASAGNNGSAIYLQGNGSGHGLYARSGSNAAAYGAKFEGISNGGGIYALGNGANPGLKCTGGLTGHGINATGGATSGSGINAVAGAGGNGGGIVATGFGSGPGIWSAGGPTGQGMLLVGGATSGSGLQVTGSNANADAITCTPNGSGLGLNATIKGTALDSGTATLEGMLLKIAGSGFVELTDALHNLSTKVATGVPTSVTASADTETTGTLISGTYALTYLSNGTYWVTAPTTPAVGGLGLNVYLSFALTAGTLVNTVTIRGFFNAAAARFCNVFAWNWQTSAWDQLSDSTSRMNNSTTNQTYNYTLLPAHQDASGNVRIGFRSASTTTTDRLQIDQCLVNVATAGATTGQIADAVYLRMRYTAYAGAIWVDTVNGYTGTDIGVNGLPTHMAKTWAEAKTLATALGVSEFRFAPGSEITLDSSVAGKTLIGHATIHLGGQDASGAEFYNAHIDGISTGTDAMFIDCRFGAATTIGPSSVLQSSFHGAITCAAGGDYLFDQCASGIPGTSTPVLIFAAAAYVGMRHYSGGIQIQNMTATERLSLEGQGQLKIHTDCTGGTIAIRGCFTVTDNVVGGFLGTLSDAARFAEDQSIASVTGNVGGNVVGTVADVVATVDANVVSMDAAVVGAIVDGVWDEDTASHQTAGTTGKALTSGSGLTLADIADAVWDEATAGHQGAGTTGLALTSSSAPSASTVASAVWEEALVGHATAGTAGKALTDILALSAEPVDANLVQIDGTALASATLSLKKIAVTNNSGDAVVFESTGGDGRGLYVKGYAKGVGAHFKGGATAGWGHGFRSEGGGSSAHGAYFSGGGSIGDGLKLEGNIALNADGSSGTMGFRALGYSQGAQFVGGNGGGEGLILQGSGTYPGLRSKSTNGGAGAVFEALAGNAAGIVATGFGSGSGASFTPGATGNGVTIAGGATSGHGVGITTTAGDGINSSPASGLGMRLNGAGGNPALGLYGATSGAGLYAQSATGVAFDVTTAGIAVRIQGGNANGVVYIAGTANNAHGLQMVPHGTGKAITTSASVALGGLTSDITGNLSGSVGSVTGAVGSVSGDVGGKVLGGGASSISAVGAWVAGAAGGAVMLASSYTAPPTAADNADAVWDELLAGHVADGSAGATLGGLGGGTINANLVSIGGESVTESGHATLKLKALEIMNDTGVPVIIMATGELNDSPGIGILGCGTQPGMLVTGGLGSGHGIDAQAGGLGGHGIHCAGAAAGTYGFAADGVGGGAGVSAVIAGSLFGNVEGNVAGDVLGKVIGGGTSDITGVGAWVAGAAGADVALAGPDGDTLKDISDQLDNIGDVVPTPSDIASQVRVELTPELEDVVAIRAKTDALPADPASEATVAAVPDATWDVNLAMHLDAGSTGEALAAADTSSDIAAIAAASSVAVWAASRASNNDAGSMGETMNQIQPVGLRQVVIHVHDQNGASLVGTQVALFGSDNLTFMSQGVTDSSGNWTVNVDDGSYKIRLAPVGFTVSSPVDLTVTGDMAKTIVATRWVPSAPPTVNHCIVYGTPRDAQGVVLGSGTVRARVSVPGVVAGEQGVNRVVKARINTVENEFVTGPVGYFELPLVIGTTVLLDLPEAGIQSTELVVPNQANIDLADWTTA